MPGPRGRHSQRTCGEASCREERRRRTQASYYRRNAEYWVERRLREQVERVVEGEAEAAVVRPPPAEMARIPWQVGQDAFGRQGVVFIAFLLRLALKARQDPLSAQALEIVQQSGGLLRQGRQDATDPDGGGRYRPP